MGEVGTRTYEAIRRSGINRSLMSIDRIREFVFMLPFVTTGNSRAGSVPVRRRAGKRLLSPTRSAAIQARGNWYSLMTTAFDARRTVFGDQARTEARRRGFQPQFRPRDGSEWKCSVEMRGCEGGRSATVTGLRRRRPGRHEGPASASEHHAGGYSTMQRDDDSARSGRGGLGSWRQNKDRANFRFPGPEKPHPLKPLPSSAEW